MAWFTALKAMVRKPFLTTAGLGRANEDWSVIPDASFNLPLYAPAETPDGEITEFTFDFIPKAVLYNGVWLTENVGYSRAGMVISLINEYAVAFAPESGAYIRAIY